MSKKYRIERDSLGEFNVPEDAYYGVQTARAIHNFPISAIKPAPVFIKATAIVKKAAAEANIAVGKLDKKIGKAIIKATSEVIEGKFNDQFVVDVFQAGAGTSHHMNANEVIANRAIELSGGKKGRYSLIHPNDHVNMSQSTNDVYPSAMKIASLLALKDMLPAVDNLAKALSLKSKEFNNVIKSGRTHLQDALPIPLGQEFKAYSVTIQKASQRIKHASSYLKELGIGGTAVGTGVNTHPDYVKKIIPALKKITGIPVKGSKNLIESMQSMGDFAALSSSLKALACELTRIANDLRLLSSGPTTGLSEITLPPVQPGSSIMPGKVNPVMAEVLNMVCFQVIGNDLAITTAVQAGQFELNVMMPVINFNILTTIEILTNVIIVFTNKCVKGILVNKKRCKEYADRTVGLATLLNQYIGYEAAAKVASESINTGKSIKEIIIMNGLLTEKEIGKVF